MKNIIEETKSLCPKCLKILTACIFEKDGKVWIEKTCPKHGRFEDLCFGSFEMYKKFRKFSHDGKGIANPKIKAKGVVCPKVCGLCRMHKSHTALGNVVVTNRCDLTCFYCFFYAKAMGYVYEPSLKQIREMLRSMKKEKPVPCKAVQLTGGEPLLREDILDIIKIAKQEGYKHIQLNTNGVRLAQNLQLTKKIRKAGVNTIYLSFDGTTSKTNPKNHWEIPRILKNCTVTGMSAILVPTIINTVNDHDVGNILKFGLENINVVRGVNYQPVSLVGRITKADVKKYRITIPDVIERMEKQTNGMVAKEDFYPVPSVTAITHIMEAMKGRPQYEFSTHHVCGAATYLFLDGIRVIPITRFVDVEGFLEFLNENANEIRSGGNKFLVAGKILYKLGSFIDKKKQPSNVDLAGLFYKILIENNYRALRELHHKTIFVGMMHFMDLYNYDIERVERCCVHYAQLDGRIIPFCAFNVIPEWYRDKIQKKYSLPIKKWEKTTGKILETDLYKRNKKELVAEAIYKKAYENF